MPNPSYKFPTPLEERIEKVPELKPPFLLPRNQVVRRLVVEALDARDAAKPSKARKRNGGKQ